MRYKAVCEEGDYESYSYILEDTAQIFAELHMMQTGHIAHIINTEVV